MRYRLTAPAVFMTTSGCAVLQPGDLVGEGTAYPVDGAPHLAELAPLPPLGVDDVHIEAHRGLVDCILTLCRVLVAKGIVTPDELATEFQRSTTAGREEGYRETRTDQPRTLAGLIEKWPSAAPASSNNQKVN